MYTRHLAYAKYCIYSCKNMQRAKCAENIRVSASMVEGKQGFVRMYKELGVGKTGWPDLDIKAQGAQLHVNFRK